MQTRVWWMRWYEKGDTVEVVVCLDHARWLAKGEVGTMLGARAIGSGVGRCELCVAAQEALVSIDALPGIPEPVLR